MIRIHVVDSIKGGCGKSTWCLLLANYLHFQDAHPYVIDLDIKGSGWYADKASYLEEKDDAVTFITNMVNNVANDLKGHYIMHLNIAGEKNDGSGTFEKYQLPICIANASDGEEIIEEELDLFEYTVFKIMEHIIFNDARFENKDIDIILDMPPGHEPHAKNIVNHLLLDINSPLVRKLEERKKKLQKRAYAEKRSLSGHEEYRLFFYLLSGVTVAGAQLNAKHTLRLYYNQTYSSKIDELLPKDQILFVINDFTKVLNQPDGDNDTPDSENHSPDVFLDNVNRVIKESFSDSVSICTLNYLNGLSDLYGESSLVIQKEKEAEFQSAIGDFVTKKK